MILAHMGLDGEFDRLAHLGESGNGACAAEDEVSDATDVDDGEVAADRI